MLDQDIQLKSMNNILILFLLTALGCSSGSSSSVNQIVNTDTVTSKLNDSIIYCNKEYKVTLYLNKNKVDYIKLYNIKNKSEISGKPELVTVDGEIPEGTNRIDYNNPNDITGYQCDSTYQFISIKINIAFATEKTTKRRLDLSIYNSTDVNFRDGDFTLQKE